MKQQYLYIYNNYQFYEYEALAGFLNRQAEKGYKLCGMSGRFADVLKFKKIDCPSEQPHIIFCKYLDTQIDTEIELCKDRTIYENIQFAVLRMPTDQFSADNASALEKQKKHMSISVKKAFCLILALLFLFTISFILKIFVAKTPFFLSTSARSVICLTPILLFFLYLAGDLHDLKNGCAKTICGCLYFTDRPKFKNTIFSFADLCVLLYFAAGAIASLFILFTTKDTVVLLELFQIWFICLFAAYIFRLQYRNSYIYLLFIAVFLIVFGI